MTRTGKTSENLRRASDGDREAVHWIVERFHPYVLGVARGFELPANSDAEQIAQDVWFSYIARGFQARERPAPQFMTWIRQTVQNRALESWAAIRRERSRAAALANAGTEEIVVSACNAAIRSEILDKIERAIEALDGRSAAVVRARLYEGSSYEEIAARHAVSAAHGRVVFQRALAKLSGRLEESYLDDVVAADDAA